MTAVAHGRAQWMRPALVAVLMAAVLCAVVPFASDYVLHVLITSMYYTMLAASWNLLAGFTGQFSLAHQAFAAIGAYTSGLMMVRYELPIWAAIACGIVAAGVLGLALGRMVLRMRAIYLAIVCLIPEILISYAAVPFYFGGTSLLIVVSVTMDTVAQVQGYLLAHQYEGLIRKSKLRGRRR